MTLHLQVRLSTGTSYPWEHPGPRVRIGRNPACELPLTGPQCEPVSWEHACVEVRQEGIFLRDLRSSNGTFVNGQPIRSETALHAGDQIGLGQTGPRLELVESKLPGSLLAIRKRALVAGPLPKPPRPFTFERGTPSASARALNQARPSAAVGNNRLPMGLAKPAAAAPPATSGSTRAGSTTRLFLMALQSGNRRLWVLFGVAVLGLLALGGFGFTILCHQNSDTAEQLGDAGNRAISAQEEARKAIEEAHQARTAALEEARQARAEANKARAQARLAEEAVRQARGSAHFTGPEVYQRTLRSTAFVAVRFQSGEQGNGTGSLIDRKRRLVLTAYHVVDKTTEVHVFFPAFRAGQVICDRSYYEDKQAGLWIKGKVVARDARCDLALIQLEAVPAEVPEMLLAAASATPGTTVHTVGNPGASAGLWAYTVGAVRQVARRKYKFASKQLIDALVVETQNPINKGDSGGPVVNDDVELVAVNSGAGSSLRDGTLCIDVHEVKTLLARVRP